MHDSLIKRALLNPNFVVSLSNLDWDLLMRQGRSTGLLARLHDVLESEGLTQHAPTAARHHMTSASRIAQRQAHANKWEIECIHAAIKNACSCCALLKGAAYLACDLPHARSRIFSDVDILVRKGELPEIESALIMHGWRGEELSAYDQRYYRRWMHELPPMRHTRRGTSIDVHHTILPETARIQVNTPALFDGLMPISGVEGFYALQPADMVLHSATHLFHEGEFDHGLRDLFDLDSMLKHFGSDASFWPLLVQRATTLRLTRPLFYTLRYTRALLGTQIPQGAIAAASVGAPGAIVLRLMDWCYQRALRPAHASCDNRPTRIARRLLYLRSHWLRMPIHLLTYHLGRKVFQRLTQKADDQQPAIQ